MKPTTMEKRCHTVLLALALVGVCTAKAPAANWPVFGFDPARSGFNNVERTLTVANVHKLRARWQVSLGAIADSTPILLARVRIGSKYRTMLFQTTKSGITLGMDATTGHILWRFSSSGPNYTHSTPAADPSGTVIYAPALDGMVHKLNVSNGHEIRGTGFPVRITRMPSSEADESALNVANGYLYATTSGYNGDAPPYDGHVVSVRLSDGSTTVFNSLCSDYRKLPGPHTCSQQLSGIWSRGGAVVDPDASLGGRIYAATGNGDFDGNQPGGDNFGDSILSLSPHLEMLLGYYAPADYAQLQSQDLDLGSTSPALLPAQGTSQTPWMLVQGGKDAEFRLLNRAALPGVGNELQNFNIPAELFATPAVWTDSSNHVWVFLDFSNLVQAYRLKTDARGISTLHMVWQANPGNSSGEGTSAVVADGVVFVAFDNNLVALNALTGTLLWSSTMRTAGKTIGPVHWESPIVINGAVYCSDENGHLTAYSL
ncbi:MAG: PQQ-binding-like beta-propeller repeat protein [Candidatus Eremiobacteraeota bacterium]|nr:PQQ-binding-like beta-propeller repeat protein [Candidatus Eremiobacteraeota bacterium]